MSPIVQTRRLEMKKMIAGDIDLLYQLTGDREVMKFFPHALSHAETRQMLDKILDHYERYDHCFWKVLLKKAGISSASSGFFIKKSRGKWRPRYPIASDGNTGQQRICDGSGAGMQGIWRGHIGEEETHIHYPSREQRLEAGGGEARREESTISHFHGGRTRRLCLLSGFSTPSTGISLRSLPAQRLASLAYQRSAAWRGPYSRSRSVLPLVQHPLHRHKPAEPSRSETRFTRLPAIGSMAWSLFSLTLGLAVGSAPPPQA